MKNKRERIVPPSKKKLEKPKVEENKVINLSTNNKREVREINLLD